MKRLLLLLCCLSLSMHAMKKPLTFASVKSAIETKSAQEAAAVLQKYVNEKSESGSRVAIQFWNAKYPTMKFKSSAFQALLAGEAPTVPEKPITPPVKPVKPTPPAKACDAQYVAIEKDYNTVISKRNLEDANGFLRAIDEKMSLLKQNCSAFQIAELERMRQDVAQLVKTLQEKPVGDITTLAKEAARLEVEVLRQAAEDPTNKAILKKEYIDPTEIARKAFLR